MPDVSLLFWRTSLLSLLAAVMLCLAGAFWPAPPAYAAGCALLLAGALLLANLYRAWKCYLRLAAQAYD